MAFTDLVAPPQTGSFADRCAPKVDCDLQSRNDHARHNTEKHLHSALHAVNLRILQLQNATFKAQKTSKGGQILSQLHDLTHYQSMLSNLAGALERGDKSVCYQTYLTSVAHATSRIHDSLHEYHHEDHEGGEHDVHPIHGTPTTPTLQRLTVREQELTMLLEVGTELQKETREVKASTGDFSRVILTAAALDTASEKLREKAKESLREEVTEEVIAHAADMNMPPDMKLDEVIHRQAWKRWQNIKTRAAEIHGIATKHYEERAAAIRNVYNDMVVPHLNRWRSMAQAHGETFAGSIAHVSQLAGSLDAALASYPSEKVTSLEALHEQMSGSLTHCHECADTLTHTLDALHKQKDAITKAKEGIARALRGDDSGLKDAAAVLSMDEMKAAIGEIGDYHKEHLPKTDMGTVKKWLTSSVDSLTEALGELGIGFGKGPGTHGNGHNA